LVGFIGKFRAGGQIEDLSLGVGAPKLEAQLDPVHPRHEDVQKIDIKASEPGDGFGQSGSPVKDRNRKYPVVSGNIFVQEAQNLLPGKGIVITDRDSQSLTPKVYKIPISIVS
jgi:hypothetical protein